MSHREVELYFEGDQKGKLVYGDAPKGKAMCLNLYNDFYYIYNFKNTPKGDWYFEAVFAKEDDYDPKRFICDKSELDNKHKVYKYALQIASHVVGGVRTKFGKTEKVHPKKVYIHGRSFEDMSSIIALCALYFIRAEEDFDPIKFVRSKGIFDVAIERRHREIINFVKAKAVKSMFWFQNKKKEI